MANIKQINESAPPFAAPAPKATKSSGTDAFENALSKALDRTEATGMKQTSANALPEIASKELKFIDSSDIVSGKTQDLLKMLDVYSSKLGDPGVSLKSIAPDLEKINHNADTLLKETLKLTDADDELKKIATQTAVTAQTEYLKFQRGDYLS